MQPSILHLKIRYPVATARIKTTYLWLGIGNPCAGQVKASGFVAFSSKATRLSLEENLGFELPTGSTENAVTEEAIT